jgi:hypothetical protein
VNHLPTRREIGILPARRVMRHRNSNIEISAKRQFKAGYERSASTA